MYRVRRADLDRPVHWRDRFRAGAGSLCARRRSENRNAERSKAEKLGAGGVGGGLERREERSYVQRRRGSSRDEI